MIKMLSLNDFCLQFDSKLELFLRKNFLKLDQSWNSNFKKDKTYFCDQLIEYAIESCKNGKRFRPYLVYLMSQNPDIEYSIDYGIAIELLHTFALVHDDIMDQSEIRRGKNSIYKEYQVISGASTHTAYSMAILIGDYIFSLAEESFANAAMQQNHVEARKIYQLLKSEVILGQMLDIELDTCKNVTKDEILQKTFLKTANYSVTRPMQIGLSLSKNYSDQNLRFCEEFGFNLGLAFQIQDDYLNITQPVEVTGKLQYQDLIENKQTLAMWHLKQNGVEKISNIAETLAQYKTVEFLKIEMDTYYNQALMLANQHLEFNNLINLTNFLINRKK